MSDSHVNIVFQYESNVLDEMTKEILRSRIIDKEKGIYQLNAIPHYGPLIAPGDHFYATYNDFEELEYQHTMAYSGYSVVLVAIIKDGYDVTKIQDVFAEMDCPSEQINEAYFAMAIPDTADYGIIQEKLASLEDEEILNYAEPCLSEEHTNQKM